MAQLRGFLERWDDARGFGFIYHVDYPKGIFIHISDFKRNISRRPIVGDMICYELVIDRGGKNKAVNAWIEGVSSPSTKRVDEPNFYHNKNRKVLLKPDSVRCETKTLSHKQPSKLNMKLTLIVITVMLLFAILYYQFAYQAEHTTPISVVVPPSTPVATEKPAVKFPSTPIVTEESVVMPLSTPVVTKKPVVAAPISSEHFSCDTDKDGSISGSEQYLCENPTYDPTKKPLKGERYSCQGKVYCSQMTSCEEAEFYQDNCPNTQMDGDNDGIPCEKQWC
jgi:cold shock CspA family protein